MSDSPEDLSVLLTSSARVAMVSASLVRGLDDGVGQFLRAPDHQVDDRERLLGESFGDAVEPRRHHVFEAGRDLGEFLADVIGLEIEAAR